MDFLQDPNIAWLIAFGTLFATVRQYVGLVIARTFNIVFETHYYEAAGGIAVQSYLHYRGKSYGVGPRTYDAVSQYVRPVQRVVAVGTEILGRVGRLYRVDGHWLWAYSGGYADRQADVSVGDRKVGVSRIVHVTWLRGRIDPDKFLTTAIAFNNAKSHALLSGQDRRHRVRIVTGSAGQIMAGGAFPNSTGAGSSSSGPQVRAHGAGELILAPPCRYIGWEEKDFGYADPNRNPLDDLALSPELQQLAREIKHWRDSQPWYAERRIPHRISLGFKGPPGTGKTAYLRAIAEWLDLPVYVLDLASMTNRELIYEWNNALTDTPCMIIVEDIDRVFDKDQPVNDEIKLTFNCLLNCMDGMVRCDGVLTAITTNHPERLDDALLHRKGRIDKMIEVNRLDAAGFAKLARKICPDRQSDWPYLEKTGLEQHMNGSEFQFFCTEHAKETYWREFHEGSKVPEAAVA